jgi:hypothetical protein
VRGVLWMHCGGVVSSPAGFLFLFAGFVVLLCGREYGVLINTSKRAVFLLVLAHFGALQVPAVESGVHVLGPRPPTAADQLRDQRSQKARYWLVLKEIIRAAPCFFLRVLAWY